MLGRPNVSESGLWLKIVILKVIDSGVYLEKFNYLLTYLLSTYLDVHGCLALLTTVLEYFWPWSKNYKVQNNAAKSISNTQILLYFVS